MLETKASEGLLARCIDKDPRGQARCAGYGKRGLSDGRDVLGTARRGGAELVYYQHYSRQIAPADYSARRTLGSHTSRHVSSLISETRPRAICDARAHV